MNSAITWFEIPAVDFDRTVDFYSTVLDRPIRKGEFGGMPHGFFPYDEKVGVGGAIIKGDVKPSKDGTLIYLDTGSLDNLDKALARVESAGGKVELPKTFIGDPGYVAIIIDVEGNRVGLHALK